MRGFINYFREQSVVALAVGFVIGGAVSKLVTSFVNDVVNPLIGYMFGAEGLETQVAKLGETELKWGSFVSTLIDFVVIAIIVYVAVKILKFELFDKKK